MSQSIRHPKILEIARREGKVTVETLAAEFDVTLQTIRKDLSDLADSGKLERVHGGAVLPSGTRNLDYEHRRALNADAKHRIAAACAADIPNNAAIFINIGTSTEAVARALLHHRGIMVITNNMNVANILVANSDCEIIVAGGSFRRSDGGLVGNLTSDTISQFKFDYAVIGCSALDQDGDMLDFDIREVGVSQSIIRRSDKVLLVADHSKFSRKAPACIASLSEVDAFYTDVTPSDAVQSKCLEWGTTVCVAPSK